MVVLTNGLGRVFLPDGETGQIESLLSNGYWVWQKEPIAPVIPDPVSNEETAAAVDWTQVKGVSDELAAALAFVGLTSKAALLEYGAENLAKNIPGIGKRRAQDLMEFARE